MPQRQMKSKWRRGYLESSFGEPQLFRVRGLVTAFWVAVAARSDNLDGDASWKAATRCRTSRSGQFVGAYLLPATTARNINENY